MAVADAGYGDNALFREELTAAGWQYVVAVKGTTSAHPAEAVPQTAPYAGRGRPPKAAYPHPPVNLRQLAIAAAGQIRPVAWRQGTRTTRGNPEAAMTSHFLAIRVRPAGRHVPRRADRSLPACWQLAEWQLPTPASRRITGCPPSPPTLPSKNWCAWPRSAGGSSTTTASSRTGLGLDHFEGRSFAGWHRHVTLAALAQAFCTLLRTDPKAPAPG